MLDILSFKLHLLLRLNLNNVSIGCHMWYPPIVVSIRKDDDNSER